MDISKLNASDLADLGRQITNAQHAEARAKAEAEAACKAKRDAELEASRREDARKAEETRQAKYERARIERLDRVIALLEALKKTRPGAPPVPSDTKAKLTAASKMNPEQLARIEAAWSLVDDLAVPGVGIARSVTIGKTQHVVKFTFEKRERK